MRTALAAPAAPPPTLRLRATVRGSLALLLGLLFSHHALADLGHNPSRKGNPIPAPQRAASQGATAPASAPAPYTTHARQLETGTVITEYANAAGVVFALAWQGPTLPELDSLLGSYFPTFQSEAARSRAQRNIGTPLHIGTGALVVYSGGRMRGFMGHAYAPALVPAGLQIQDVLP